MPISGYQVEWVINQRRRWRGLVEMVERRRRSLTDRVELSPEGSDRARQQAGPPPKPPLLPPARDGYAGPGDLADRRTYDAPVTYELERRAGSFMRPKYPPFPAPAGIPRAKRRKKDET